MQASLSLHLALYRRQKKQISQALTGASRAFRAYEARYHRDTRTYQRPATFAEVARAARAADVVYLGDYHTLRTSQQVYLELVEAVRGGTRPTVLAVEFMEGRFQPALDAYLAGKLSEGALLSQMGDRAGSNGLWAGFLPVLGYAKRHRLLVRAIDFRAEGRSSLAKRDAFAAEQVAATLALPKRPRVMVLMGQYHVAACHLPAQVRLRCSPRELTVYQNCESIYWKLARRGKVRDVEAVKVRDGAFCLLNTSPVVCQQTFLDYLEAEGDDEPLLPRGAAERFRELARLIGRFTGIPVDEALSQTEVGTAADLDFLSRVRRRGQLSPKELRQVRAQVLSRESYYIPRARTAYLASLSLNHAAEEAAHFVRHCAVGGAMEAPRRPADAFYARCLEEALGFFGSRLINPRRRCPDLTVWAKVFSERRGHQRQVAAFVLAHKAAEGADADEAAQLLPLRRDKLFHAVSHALGYLLGDALFRAFESGRLKKAEVRKLFRDPLASPRDQYREWLARA